MSLTSKIFCIAVLAASFLLILGTGRSNVRNFERVQGAIAEIYKDRLVVKGLIFQLSSLLHQKEIAVISNDITFFRQKNSSVNQKIEQHLKAFRETKLTDSEEATLSSFSNGIDRLKISENESRLSEVEIIVGEEARKLKSHLNRLKEDLETLSDIQLVEGEQKLKTGRHAVRRMNEFANLEFYALILISILMIGLFFVPRQSGTVETNSSKG